MDDHRFDDLTRALGVGQTRRGTLRAALGGLAAVAGLAAHSAAEAKKGKKARSQGKKGKTGNRDGYGTCRGECWKHEHCDGDRGGPYAQGGHDDSDCRCFPKKQGNGGICGKCIEDGEEAKDESLCCGDEYCAETETCGACPPVCTCENRSCGQDDGCGGVCGACPEHHLCVYHGDDNYSCKYSPVCAPNGETGICCSGHMKDGVCCDPSEIEAIAIIVDVDVYNQITITTPPTQEIITVVTPLPTTPSTGGGGKRKRRRRRRRRKGGRRRRR